MWSGYSRSFLWLSVPSILFPKPLQPVPSAPTRIDITVTFMFHSCFFFLSLWRDQGIYQSFNSFSISFLQNPFDDKFTFLFINTKSRLLDLIEGFAGILKSQRTLFVLFSWMDSCFAYISLYGQILISYTIHWGLLAQSAEALEYTDCISAEV